MTCIGSFSHSSSRSDPNKSSKTNKMENRFDHNVRICENFSPFQHIPNVLFCVFLLHTFQICF